jgi:hypothetical protein
VGHYGAPVVRPGVIVTSVPWQLHCSQEQPQLTST